MCDRETVDANTVGEFVPWTVPIVKERDMIEYHLDTEHSILHVQPKSALEQDDFVKLANAVDPHIEATGGLPVSSSKPRPSLDGRVLGQWSISFALFEIITSEYREWES